MATKNYNDMVSAIRQYADHTKQAATKDIEHGGATNPANSIPARQGSKDNVGGGDNEAVHGMKDDREKNAPGIPSQAAASDADSSNLHADGGPVIGEDVNRENKDGEVGEDANTSFKGESTDTNARGVLEDPHSSQSGDAKDEAVSKPNDPLSKIAHRASNILDAVRDLNNANAKAAGAPVAQASQAPQGSVANDSVANDLSPDWHFKLASAVLHSESALKALESDLEKSAGEAAAKELIESAIHQERQFAEIGEAYSDLEKQAAEEYAQLEKQAAEEAQVIEGIYKSASAEDQSEMDKVANIHAKAISGIEEDLHKVSYMQGAKEAAMMADAEEAGMAPEAMEEEMLGADGEVTAEDVAAILELMVQSGEIDEETAMAILEQLAGGDMGGEEAMMAEGAPMDEAAMGGEDYPEEMKEASALVEELVINK
jgi:hypothetical protein